MVLTIDGGDDKYLYNYNWGATSKNGAAIVNIRTKYNTAGTAESATHAAGVGQGGGRSKVGQLFEIGQNANNYSGLEIIADVYWYGIQEIIGAGGCRIIFGSSVIDDSGPTWPSSGSSYIKSDLTYVDNQAGAGIIGNPVVHDGHQKNDGTGAPSPHYISDPQQGEKYRACAYVGTYASSPWSLASARSDALEDGNNSFDGYILLQGLQFNWV